jgi:hypothetical protein
LTHYFNEERSRPYLDLSRSWRKRVLPTFVFHFSNKYIRKREVVLKLIPVILSISYLDYYNLCCAWQLACKIRRRRISDILGINAAMWFLFLSEIFSSSKRISYAIGLLLFWNHAVLSKRRVSATSESLSRFGNFTRSLKARAVSLRMQTNNLLPCRKLELF